MASSDIYKSAVILRETNYEGWRHGLVGFFHIEKCLSIATGKESEPVDATLFPAWLEHSNRTAGIICQSHGSIQHTHVDIDDGPDNMWSKIEQVYNPVLKFSDVKIHFVSQESP
jgi:hypothetical protein